MFWGNKKKENIEFSNIEIAVCTLLIHAARTDDSYSLKEKELIKTSLNKLGIENLDYINRLIKLRFIILQRKLKNLNMNID